MFLTDENANGSQPEQQTHKSTPFLVSKPHKLDKLAGRQVTKLCPVNK